MASRPDDLAYVQAQVAAVDRDITALWREMDAVWNRFGLDNRKPLSAQPDAVGRFYGHPVWIVNGIFSEREPVSRGHREAIARFVAQQPNARVADYGGGSGVLARYIAQAAPSAQVDIVEPYPSDYFVQRMTGVERVRFVPRLEAPYDLVVAQDVLEHVDDPIGVAIELLAATRIGGLAIFANAFYPFIKCHLPSTFFLRHQFNRMLAMTGADDLGGVPGAEHARVFCKRREIDVPRLRQLERIARVTGPVLNMAGRAKAGARRLLRVARG